MPKQTPLMDLTRDQLNEMYHGQKLSQWEIARKLGVTQGAIFCKMRQWQIPARNLADGIRLDRLKYGFAEGRNPRWNGGRHVNKAGYALEKTSGCFA